MSKLKGRKTLNKVITQALEPFGITSAKLSDEYCYYFEEESIDYTLEIKENDYFFNDFVEEYFGYKITNIFIFSLLHEIGHHLNNDCIEGSLYEYCQREKERLDESIVNTDEEYRQKNYEYFLLPDEMLATSWAVDYAKSHPKQLSIMWDKIEEGIHNFYKANKVEEE